MTQSVMVGTAWEKEHGQLAMLHLQSGSRDGKLPSDPFLLPTRSSTIFQKVTSTPGFRVQAHKPVGHTGRVTFKPHHHLNKCRSGFLSFNSVSEEKVLTVKHYAAFSPSPHQPIPVGNAHGSRSIGTPWVQFTLKLAPVTAGRAMLGPVEHTGHAAGWQPHR